MSRTPVNWTDLTDPTVQACLTVPCGACHAEPGVLCVNTVNGQPLHEIGRLVHHFREDKLITSSKEDNE